MGSKTGDFRFQIFQISDFRSQISDLRFSWLAILPTNKQTDDKLIDKPMMFPIAVKQFLEKSFVGERG